MMSFALAHSNDDDGYPEPLNPEIQRAVRALEAGEISLANIEGVRARMRNQPADANLYAQECAELAAAWQLGWDEADESIGLDNLVTVLCDFFADLTYTPEGQPLPSRHLVEILRVEHMKVLKYRT